MSANRTSQRRRQAEAIFAEAQEAYAAGRLAWAVEHAREALRIDRSYSEVRHWLAERYLEAGAVDRASRQYQSILRANRDDERAWRILEKIDPEGAASVRRFHEIPPDPFVRRRRARASEELESLEEVTVDQPAGEGVAPFLRHEEDFDALDSLDDFAPPPKIAEEDGGLPRHGQEGSVVFEPLDELSDEELEEEDEPLAGEFDEDCE